MNRWVVFGLSIFVLTLVLVLLVLWQAPRVIAIYPEIGAEAVPASSSLRIAFSRPMQPKSVNGRLVIQPETPGTYQLEGTTLTFTPDQPWRSGETVQVMLSSGARAAGFFSLPVLRSQTWSFSIGNPRLLFLSPADGPANLYLLDLQKNESQQLTSSAGGLTGFDVNYKGDVVYFSARQGQGNSAIFRLNLLSEITLGEAEIILDCPKAACTAPRISPDGKLLAYERTAALENGQPSYPQVWMAEIPAQEVDQNSGDIPALQPTLAGDPQNQTYLPAWSPGGQLTYYDTQKKGFVVLDPTSGERTLFANQTGEPGSWHANNRDYVAAEISYTNPDQPGATSAEILTNSHLILYNRSDGSTTDLTINELIEDASPAFSPDGAYLAFARRFIDMTRWTPGRQLWVMLSSGGDARPMTDDPFYNHYDIAWHPNERQLAYVRFNQSAITEPPEIWLMDIISNRNQQIFIGGYAPQWIP
jgi:Tol biopolymer transport system component